MRGKSTFGPICIALALAATRPVLADLPDCNGNGFHDGFETLPVLLEASRSLEVSGISDVVEEWETIRIPERIVAVDLDNDNNRELAIVHKGIGLGMVTVVRHIDGVELSAVNNQFLNPCGSSIAAGDFDGDGWQDLVVGTECDSSARLLFNAQSEDADVWVTPSREFGRSGPVLVADMNGDDLPDLICLGRDGQMMTSLNLRDGAFSDPESFYIGIGPVVDAKVVDIEGDGDRDIVLLQRVIHCDHSPWPWEFDSSGCLTPDTVISVVINEGDGMTFRTTGTLVSMEGRVAPSGMALGSFRDDANPSPDLAILSRGYDKILLYSNKGSDADRRFLGFERQGEIALARTDSARPQDLVASDVNNDGYVDLATVNRLWDEDAAHWDGSNVDVSVFLNNIEGEFGPEVRVYTDILASSQRSIQSIIAANLDVDEEIDLAILSMEMDENLGRVAVLMNRPDQLIGTPDCNRDRIPDSCEPDSDGDGIIDDCETSSIRIPHEFDCGTGAPMLMSQLFLVPFIAMVRMRRRRRNP